VSLAAQKQIKKHDGPNVEMELTMLTKHLKLSDDQVLKLKPILENYAKEQKQLREARMKLQKSKTDDIKKILTSEQNDLFPERMRMERREKHFGGRKDGFKKLLKHLNLSDSQKKQLKGRTEPLQKQFKADLAKAETRDAKKALFESHRKALKDALDTVLTDEQKENFKKFRDKRGKRGEREKRKH
jgi:Spy/CpxP family protein refolding chaperone